MSKPTDVSIPDIISTYCDRVVEMSEEIRRLATDSKLDMESMRVLVSIQIENSKAYMEAIERLIDLEIDKNFR